MKTAITLLTLMLSLLLTTISQAQTYRDEYGVPTYQNQPGYIRNPADNFDTDRILERQRNATRNMINREMYELDRDMRRMERDLINGREPRY